MKYQLPDNIDQHWLWKDDPAKFQWWLLLLREVGDGETERMVRGVVCKFGFGELVFLRKLESKGEIRRKTDAKLTRIFICNIADYDILGRNLDAKLTHRRKVDAILTQLIDAISGFSEDDRRNLDAKLTQKKRTKRNI